MKRYFTFSTVIGAMFISAPLAAWADEESHVCSPKVFKNDNWVSIPDYSGGTPGFAKMFIDVPTDPNPNCRLIGDLNVDVIITHTYQGDLRLVLKGPGGQTVTLMDRPGYPQTSSGFSANDLGNYDSGIPFYFDDQGLKVYDSPAVASPGINQVTGNWRPENSINATFGGLPKAGRWELQVYDMASTDTGKLKEFSLHIVNVPEPVTCGLVAPGLLMFLRRRRV